MADKKKNKVAGKAKNTERKPTAKKTTGAGQRSERTTSAKKTAAGQRAAQKPAPKTPVKKATANKPAAVKKPAVTKKQAKPATPKAAAPKKATSQSKARKITAIKHSDKFELGTGGDKSPIIINAKNSKPKRAPKVLKRVARSGGYTAWDARTGKTFATEKEALDYATDVMKKTGTIGTVSPTDRQVTHTFKAEKTEKG